MEKITVLMVCDYRLVMEAWATLFTSDGRFIVIGQTDNAEAAYGIASRQRPNVVVVDINISPGDGIEIIKNIRRFSPQSRTIGISTHNLPVYAKKMLQAGAMGYVTKNSPKEELINALVSVRSGSRYICEEVKQVIVEDQFRIDTPEHGLRKLTRTELNIIQAIKEGLSSKEIAVQFHIALKTVEVHRYNILKKLSMRNVAALVNYMHEQGL
jgi:two-component system invasion response regulator UvrY